MGYYRAAFARWLFLRLTDRALERAPDFVIGDRQRPYMNRWHLVPRNRYFNIYLHEFLRSDDDRAEHDHPWLFNISFLLDGNYIEHTPKGQEVFTRGAIKFRNATSPHRIEIAPGCAPCWPLFITDPKVRNLYVPCKSPYASPTLVHHVKFTKTTQNRSRIS